MGDDEPGPLDEHDRRDSHQELWRAINITREKSHQDAKVVSEIQYRIGLLEDWKAEQDREVLAHGKELSAINVNLGNVVRSEERREQREAERTRQIIAVIALIMTGISIISSVLMYFVMRAFAAAPK